MKRLVGFFLLFTVFLSACAPAAAAELPTVTEAKLFEENLLDQFTVTPLPSLTPSATIAPSATLTLTPSLTPTPTSTPTATWVFNEAGKVVAPILLYHHISDEDPYNRYYVSIENFRAQMQALKDWGYTSIPISLLLEALIDGAELPEKPVVITFDDGALDVYENAWPIMQEFDFSGVFYIVSTRLEAEEFVDADQIKEMVASGWEIGSHSRSHSDLTLDHDTSRDEILLSKTDLEEALGIDVETFAYPFGLVDDYIIKRPYALGYRGAVGLGVSFTHTSATIYYLDRIEIHGDFTLEDFATRLPWSDIDQEE